MNFSPTNDPLASLRTEECCWMKNRYCNTLPEGSYMRERNKGGPSLWVVTQL